MSVLLTRYSTTVNQNLAKKGLIVDQVVSASCMPETVAAYVTMGTTRSMDSEVKGMLLCSTPITGVEYVTCPAKVC